MQLLHPLPPPCDLLTHLSCCQEPFLRFLSPFSLALMVGAGGVLSRWEAEINEVHTRTGKVGLEA